MHFGPCNEHSWVRLWASTASSTTQALWLLHKASLQLPLLWLGPLIAKAGTTCTYSQQVHEEVEAIIS